MYIYIYTWSKYSDLTWPGPPKGSFLQGKSPYLREILVCEILKTGQNICMFFQIERDDVNSYASLPRMPVASEGLVWDSEFLSNCKNLVLTSTGKGSIPRYNRLVTSRFVVKILIL